jgi:hypothetical protein
MLYREILAECKINYGVLKLLSYVAQTVACNPLAIAISVKETDHPFRPLEGLNQTIE